MMGPREIYEELKRCRDSATYHSKQAAHLIDDAMKEMWFMLSSHDRTEVDAERRGKPL